MVKSFADKMKDYESKYNSFISNMLEDIAIDYSQDKLSRESLIAILSFLKKFVELVEAEY